MAIFLDIYEAIMRSNHRIRILARILKNAGYMSDLVDRVLSQKPIQRPAKEVPYTTLPISLGPGTSIMIPANPVKPDGSVDFVISFKAIGPGDTQGAGRMGTNAVVVSVYLPDRKDPRTGKLRFASYRKYGKNFVNRAISTVLTALQKKYPNKKIHKGKLTVMWWSAGWTGGQQILQEMPNEVDAALSIDGMHSRFGDENRQLAAFVQFAEQAKQNPNKRFTIISTGVDPGRYASTADTAQYVAKQVGLDTNMQTSSGNYVGRDPAGVSSNNGLSWVQFMPPSERAGQYSLENMKTQHRDVYRWGRDNLRRLLGLI